MSWPYAKALTDFPLFELGSCGVTPGARDALTAVGVRPTRLLRRHVHGDWAEHDLAVQWDSLETGAWMFSVYTVGEETVWVITEGGGDDGRRASTCVLLPSEY